jgi:hypothetical protein
MQLLQSKKLTTSIGLIKIRDLKNFRELKDIVNRAKQTDYSDGFFEIDYDMITTKMMMHAQSGHYLKVIEVDKEVRALCMAVINRPMIHCNDKVVSMIYYFSDLKGRTAVKSLKLIHRDLIDYARQNKIKYCITNSILKNYETFNKILVQDGWERMGCMLVYRVDR